VIPSDVCQRWLLGRHSYRPAREVIDPARFEVAEVAELTAKAFVTKHHYSKRFPAARFRFGMFDRGELVGVAVFSRPFRAEVITNALPWLDDVDQGVELGRFVLLDSVAANAETWFLARCFAALRGRVRGVVSFSDPNPRTGADGHELFPGHIGTIYQASNASYLGKTKPATLWLLPDGTVFSNIANGKIRRALCGWRSAAAELERFGAEPLPDITDADGRIAWLERWRSELTGPMRHRGLHRYTFTIDRYARRSRTDPRAHTQRRRPDHVRTKSW
jgi:hypothetical protein